jgi:cytochrome c oxidase subunit 2
MRLILTLLILAVLVLGVWTFQVAPDMPGWWFPEDVSSHGHRIDGLFNLIMWMVGITFVLTQAALLWAVFVYSGKKTGKAVFTHGNHRLEQVWTAVPAVLLLVIAFAQMEVFADMRFDANAPSDSTGSSYTIERPIAQVWASQFDWRARYPDEEGNFGGMNVVETPFFFTIPKGEPVVFHVRSRDVLHSFFAPNLRIKQDAVPGMTIPVWFTAEKVGEYDLICAELCGWGHYKMAGKVRVLERADYDAWLAAERLALQSNGQEERQ